MMIELTLPTFPLKKNFAYLKSLPSNKRHIDMIRLQLLLYTREYIYTHTFTVQVFFFFFFVRIHSTSNNKILLEC